MERGSSAAFGVPMAFEANSVSTGYSGGAVYAGGKVIPLLPSNIIQNITPLKHATPSARRNYIYLAP